MRLKSLLLKTEKMTMQLEIKTSTVFEKNWDSILAVKSESGEIVPKYRFIINQGGSRSSKTYSICQLIIIYCLTNPNKIVSIVRKSFPSLRGSVMRDFFEVMRDLNIYNINEHHKTENVYHFSNGSSVEFFAVDDEQKLRGRKRDLLWANEANELNFEEFNQLNMRTSGQLIFDFNPSDNYHWLYDLIPREESTLIHSTYKDNPFLESSLVKEIENLINVDEGYYKIYALGEKAMLKSNIFTHWKRCNSIPNGEIVYGLDFGYNHPTALIETIWCDGNVYVNEIIYKSGLTVSDLILMLKDLDINKKNDIVCDTARPEIIEELRRNGYNAVNAIKAVKDGIDSVKSSPLYINNDSENVIKEIMNYKWKTSGDRILDEPVKLYDDAMDAMRYAIHYYVTKNKKGGPVKIFKL
jgi:phage terminase large subunit